MKFAELKAVSKEYNEHNDCAVVAVAVSCDVSYEKAHAAVKEAGRKDRRRCWFNDHCRPAIEALGFEIIEETFPGKTVVTLERDLKRYARGRRFFITVRSHFLAFDGEEIVDWTKGRRNRIAKVYRVKRVNTPERGTVTERMTSNESNFEELERVDRVEDYEALDKVESWMRDLPRPQGAPEKGARIVQTIATGETFGGEVVGYLASQFIIDTGNGERVIAIGDDWVQS